jgi:hypothetical protein
MEKRNYCVNFLRHYLTSLCYQRGILFREFTGSFYKEYKKHMGKSDYKNLRKGRWKNSVINLKVNEYEILRLFNVRFGLKERARHKIHNTYLYSRKKVFCF